jgi:hypothetical protein
VTIITVIQSGFEGRGLAAVSVLIIRAHTRFAVRSSAKLRQPRRRGVEGLLIELSVEGGRISNLPKNAGFKVGDSVQLGLAGAPPVEARIRWIDQGTVGLRFARPLSFAALEMLVRLCRAEDMPPVPAVPLRAPAGRDLAA